MPGTYPHDDAVSSQQLAVRSRQPDVDEPMHPLVEESEMLELIMEDMERGRQQIDWRRLDLQWEQDQIERRTQDIEMERRQDIERERRQDIERRREIDRRLEIERRQQIEREQEIERMEQDDLYNGHGFSEDMLQTDEQIALDLQRQEDERASHTMLSQEVQQLELADFMVALQLQTDLASEEISPPTRMCVVCGDAVPVSQLPALMSCNHEPRTCADCFSNWIASELESKGWQNISCPETNCRNTLQHAEVQIYATLEIFLKYFPFISPLKA
jgi:hypothetical protein